MEPFSPPDYLSLEQDIFTEYETDMLERTKAEFIDEGHFLQNAWLRGGGEQVSVAPERPLVVHTFFRGEDGESYAHDSHPFVACMHLLKEANESSLVTISVPYLTDTYFLDELCHFAKPLRDGGRDLEIRIILGPSQMNIKVIRDYFIGNSLLRFQAVNLLHIRTHGIDGPRGSFMHSKAFLSTAGGLVGSYDYTFAARFRNREDGVLLPSGPSPDFLRQQVLSVWEVATPVTFPEVQTSPKPSSSGTKRKEPPLGYDPSRKH